MTDFRETTIERSFLTEKEEPDINKPNVFTLKCKSKLLKKLRLTKIPFTHKPL